MPSEQSPLLSHKLAQILTSTCSIAIFRTCPPTFAGTVGAIFNCGLQLGSAVGLAAATAIETSIDAKTKVSDPLSYKGRAAVYWFILAIVGVAEISLWSFYRIGAEHKPAPPEDAEKAAGAKSTPDEMEATRTLTMQEIQEKQNDP